MHKLSLSEELMNPCTQTLNFHAARMELRISNPSSLATGHRRAISRTGDSALALSPAPGADPGNTAGNGAPKGTEITAWGMVPNAASCERAHRGEKLPHVHRFRLNSRPPT